MTAVAGGATASSAPFGTSASSTIPPPHNAAAEGLRTLRAENQWLPAATVPERQHRHAADVEQRDVDRRRALEAERKLRVFDRKVRTLGQCPHVLDAQVAEREAYRLMEADRERQWGQQQRQVGAALNQAELEKQASRKAAEQEAERVNAALRAHPAEQVPRIQQGPMALAYGGEDASKDAREAAQRAQQRRWLDEQRFEKEASRLVSIDRPTVDAEVEARRALELDAASKRRLLLRKTQEHNMGKAQEKTFDRDAFREQALFDAPESGAPAGADGRLLRNDFRGFGPSREKETLVECAETIRLRAEARASRLADDRRQDREMEGFRRTLVRLEAERKEEHDCLEKSCMVANLEAPKPEQAPLRNEIGQEFWQQWNTTTR